ncbi:DUF4260 domain-containing protein [Notoacmeibacter sp. MSK16QG-6]|uniref:DUF4260 domain-containing protein n=1 Tax=Notoacmeibacter sp. MSK16QG-6 TaxID=2957982 RepID=UPI00209C7DB3|nr:DUF4260 domain-containing protein [Notoacmeibacter sp. MSK16QG-6]MCP1199207.1 DUF4260 domain-containing protein [Notoacmeibacter sp. MSK16QG-6]
MAEHRQSGMNWLLRLEGLALFGAATLLYLQLPAPASWWIYLIGLLVPDLSMLGYLAGPVIGAVTYNIFHMTVGPILLAIVGWMVDLHFSIDIAAIWLAHIGLDRTLGFGLKKREGFRHTHLGEL